MDGITVIKTIFKTPEDLTPDMYYGARRLGIFSICFGTVLIALWAFLAYAKYSEELEVSIAEKTIFQAETLSRDNYITRDIELTVTGQLQIAQTKLREASGEYFGSSGYSITPLTGANWSLGDPVPVLLISPDIAMLQADNASMLVGEYLVALGISDLSQPSVEATVQTTVYDVESEERIRNEIPDIAGVTDSTVIVVGITPDTQVISFGGNPDTLPPTHIPGLIFLLLGIVVIIRIRVAKPNR